VYVEDKKNERNQTVTKATKLTATLPNGEVITRTTARTYTHVVVYQYDAAAREAYDTDPAWAKNEARNHAYSVREAAESPAPVAGEPEWMAERRLRTVANAQKFIADFPTSADYMAHRLAGRRAYSVRVLAEGWHVAGWCGRYDLALKLKAPAFSGKVEIIPVNA
jgi:hypothetical protein